MQTKTKCEGSVAVLGAGSWGLALTVLLARNKCQVKLWSKIPAEIQELLQHRCIKRYLPDIKLPETVAICSNIADAVSAVRDVLIVVPSQHFHATLELIRPHLLPEARIFWGTKGLDGDDRLLHEAVQTVIGAVPMAVISGPTFALEVAHGLPTAITVAANDSDFAHDLVSYLHNDTFRVYTNSDLIGVQISGAVKNVHAIAVGIADGMGFGANARAALITRGLAELTRLGKCLGGKTETFMGLAGVGDLILTCTDNQSRNRRFGLAIGAGQTRVEAEQAIGQVIEGIANAKTTHYLAQRLGIDMPIVDHVYKILYAGLLPKDAVNAILQRSQREEVE